MKLTRVTVCFAFVKRGGHDEYVADEPTQTLAFRLPDSLVERIDAYIGTVNSSMPGLGFSRAQAVRVLLEKSLNAEGIPPSSKAKARKKGGGR